MLLPADAELVRNLSRKGCTATAALGCVRILKDKPGLHERILPVERHAVQEQHALGVNEHPYIFEGEDMIARPWFGGEFKLITQARTASTENAQPKPTGYAFASEGIADFAHSFRSDEDLLFRGRFLRSILRGCRRDCAS